MDARRLPTEAKHESAIKSQALNRPETAYNSNLTAVARSLPLFVVPAALVMYDG